MDHTDQPVGTVLGLFARFIDLRLGTACSRLYSLGALFIEFLLTPGSIAALGIPCALFVLLDAFGANAIVVLVFLLLFTIQLWLDKVANIVNGTIIVGFANFAHQ